MKDHPLNTIDPHHHDHAAEEEEEDIDQFPVSIFDAAYCGEQVPEGFDAVRISIDGKLKADLSWKKEREAAQAYAAQGLRIFWDIDLGLPNILHHALSNRTQFLSLTLSLEHFCKTLWKEFRKETAGLCLFRGTLDLIHSYPWDEEQIANLQDWMSEHYLSVDTPIQISVLKETQKTLLNYFCRDALSEYLGLLASAVPDHLPLFLLLDASEIDDPFVEAQLLNKEYFSRFHLGVKTQRQLLGGEINWEGIPSEKGMIGREIQSDPKSKKPKLALCLPSRLICHPCSLQAALASLQNNNVSFRIISEGNLAIEWDGLDDLIVDTQFVSPQFKRRLQGFCAAGGRVVYAGGSLGLAEEIPFDAWLSKSSF